MKRAEADTLAVVRRMKKIRLEGESTRIRINENIFMTRGIWSR